MNLQQPEETLVKNLAKDQGIQVTDREVKAKFTQKKLLLINDLFHGPRTIADLVENNDVNEQTVRKYIKEFENQGLVDRGIYGHHQGYFYHLNKRTLVHLMTSYFSKPIEKLDEFHFFVSEFNGKEVNFEAMSFGCANSQSPARSATSAFGFGLAYLWYKSYSEDNFDGPEMSEVLHCLEKCREVILTQANMMMKALRNPIWTKQKVHLLLDSDVDPDLMKVMADFFVANWDVKRLTPMGVNPEGLDKYVENMKETLMDQEDEDE